MVILPKEYEGTEDLTWIWIFHFQEADLQYTPWPTVSLSSLSSLPSIQILKTLSPSQPSLQSTSCNKAQIRRLPMFAFCLVYFCVSSEHIHPSQQCLGSELWWAGVWVDRILPKGASHITLDWWWQWWRWCCWWRQWRWWCWWLFKCNKLHSLVTIPSEGKKKESDKDFGLPKLIWNWFYTWSNPNLSVYSILIIVSVLSISNPNVAFKDSNIVSLNVWIYQMG